ncbi:inactive peptidyl-prolyl cis-trans isomerase FKBP6 [Euwallacea fornicatus]|uniref:inactive peptidyl-prolyl cis-trans isomerase FKBP6 n=1 Tax=Euwallacea fornicatus TaxID=995702 RepID=UPI00338F33D5
MKEGNINIEELISTGTTIEFNHFEATSNGLGNDDNEVTKEEYDKEILNHVNLNCLGDFEDNDVHDCMEPFTFLETKMTESFCNGGIKKRVLQVGYGNKPDPKSIVRVHYNAYIEFNEEPFDSTYARKTPHQFVVATGEVLPGLDIAVQSMQLNEMSQFLIKPHLAYGTQGCLDRIPPNAVILFQVELIEIIESAASEMYKVLPEEQKNDFNNVYKFCISQCTKAKDLFNRNIRSAIKDYNMAVAALERAQLHSYEDQVSQQELLYKLYSNLVVCYTKVQEPKKACINFNKIRDLVKGTDLKISAKAYFNNARCLRMLGDYDLAKSRLQKAHNLEPRNPEILNEFKVIDEETRKCKERHKKMAEAFVKVQ